MSKRALPDAEIFRWAAGCSRRIVTENIKDFRPLLARGYATGEAIAPLLLGSPRRFPRGSGDRTEVIIKALTVWLRGAEFGKRPDEDWLVQTVADGAIPDVG
jgi:hypothetical protein